MQEQEKIVDEFSAQLTDSTEKRLLKEEVDAEDIAENVAKATGIPVMKMMAKVRRRWSSFRKVDTVWMAF